MSTRCFIHDSSIEYLPLLLGYFKRAGFDIFGRIPQFRQYNLSASIGWFLKTCAFHALFLGITFFPSNHMDAIENHSHACRMQQFLHFYTLIIFQLSTICFFFNI